MSLDPRRSRIDVPKSSKVYVPFRVLSGKTKKLAARRMAQQMYDGLMVQFAQSKVKPGESE